MLDALQQAVPDQVTWFGLKLEAARRSVTEVSMRWAIAVVALLLLSQSPAAAQRVAYGSAWRPPMVAEPGHWTERKRELWNMLVFNAFDNQDHINSGRPFWSLEESMEFA